MAAEVEHLRKLVNLGNDQWQGWASFLVYSANAASHSRTLEGQTFPQGIRGKGAPLGRRSTAIFNPRGPQGREKGVALVVGYYETPRDPTRAKLRVRGMGLDKRLLVDVDGKIIDGPDPADPRNAYKITEGTNIVKQRFGLAVLETAADAADFDPAQAMNFYDSVNESATPHILNAQAQELWMVDVQMTQEYGGSLVYLNYYMGWLSKPDNWDTVHPGVAWEGWNSQLFSQKGCWVEKRIPILDGDNLIEVDPRQKTMFLPNKEISGDFAGGWTLRSTTPGVRATHPIKDFSVLDAKEVYYVD